MEKNIESAQEGTPPESLSRRNFIKYSAAAGVALPVLARLTGSSTVFRSRAVAGSSRLQTVRWISPRGSLEVMDDYNLHVAMQMGYFQQFGIEPVLIAGPLSDALAATTFVAANKADMG